MKYRKVLLFICFSILTHVALAQLTMKKQSDGILIVDGTKNVLFYQINPVNIDGAYERCNYIHPLWSLKGEVLTEDFPSDHLHHRGLFWAWHQVWIGDKRIGDSWELRDFSQSVDEIEFIKSKDGSVYLQTEVSWTSGNWKENGKERPFICERATIHILPQKSNYRRIDFTIKLQALVDSVKIGGSEDEKGYGGFSFRMKLPEDIRFSGKNASVNPHKNAVKSDGFINISGSIEKGGKKGGIVLIDNPANPGYPQSWILRSKHSMQNVVWPGREAVDISKTKPLILKYSLLVYTGKLHNNKIINLAK